MPTQVPTAEEFAALEARVAALEGSSRPPGEPPPPDTEDVQARRICDLVEIFGVNTFSSADQNNLWGSWPADYRAETVIKALKWMLGDSGFALRIREYHYAGREKWQTPWLDQIAKAIPGTRASVCVGANGGDDDAASVVAMMNDRPDLWVWGEAINEPNTDFGEGEVAPETVAAMQAKMNAACTRKNALMGPSVVAGMPRPDAYIAAYFGSEELQKTVCDNLNYANGHYYPPHSPDLIGDGTSLTDYIGGLWSAYRKHVVQITEFHPTLYGTPRPVATAAAAPDNRDVYYGMLSLFRCASCSVGLWWYALFDYGSTYQCGLFPRDDSNPRGFAQALRRLCAVTGDRGADKRSFAPGKLAYSVQGMEGRPIYCDTYQASDGRFFLALWRSEADAGGPALPVTFTFGKSAKRLAEYDILAHDEAVQAKTDASQLTVRLDAGCRIIVIEA